MRHYIAKAFKRVGLSTKQVTYERGGKTVTGTVYVKPKKAELPELPHYAGVLPTDARRILTESGLIKQGDLVLKMFKPEEAKEAFKLVNEEWKKKEAEAEGGDKAVVARLYLAKTSQLRKMKEEHFMKQLREGKL